MLKLIDNFLNKTTMYRLVLYCLILLLAVAFAASWFGVMPFGPWDLVLTTIFILAICIVANALFAWAYDAPTNIESVYITALILVCIITPAHPFANLVFLAWAGVLAMATKYILAIYKKHIFNPAGVAVVLTALFLNQAASWWIGNIYLAPFVLVTGLLIVRKIKRFDLILSFFVVALIATLAPAILKGQNIFTVLKNLVIFAPMMFLAFVMLTEPMTTTPTRKLRIWYGALVGFLFAPTVHLGSIYFTPELALIAGNVFSYILGPKQKLILSLKARKKIATDTYNYVFESDRQFKFLPGQYLEWTLEHPDADNRGIRRYFTIASSPTEKYVILGVKFYDHPSTFKRALAKMNLDDKIIASQLAGDFVLPPDPNQKLVFIAGGIGITPFRSMIKYLIDKNEKRDIVVFYSNKFITDVAYSDLLEEARQKLNIKTVYALTELDSIPSDWREKRGFINQEMITQEVPDYAERKFYISGPPSMVSTFITTLEKMGVKNKQIKTDYFPGFA